jgi:hypothetical protein
MTRMQVAEAKADGRNDAARASCAATWRQLEVTLAWFHQMKTAAAEHGRALERLVAERNPEIFGLRARGALEPARVLVSASVPSWRELAPPSRPMRRPTGEGASEMTAPFAAGVETDTPVGEGAGLELAEYDGDRAEVGR